MSTRRFGTPSRFTTATGEVVFEVPIKPARLHPLGLSLSSPSDWDRTAETVFLAFREMVLQELIAEPGLFRNPPTFKTLDGMTAHWLGQAKTIKADPPMPVFDLVLKKLQISRSRIDPVWELVEGAAASIDFDWGTAATTAAAELEEVSDVPVSAGGETPFVLTDPAAKARAKLAAKAQVRQLFAAANNARLEAETAAAAFLDTYDLSDTESAFSEWMSADEDESGED